MARQAFAWEATEGRPYDGQTVNVLAVTSSQFEAHEARLAAFEEATGIDVVYDYVPFPNMHEALTTEMVAGGGDYDVVSVMDQWVAVAANAAAADRRRDRGAGHRPVAISPPRICATAC